MNLTCRSTSSVDGGAVILSVWSPSESRRVRRQANDPARGSCAPPFISSTNLARPPLRTPPSLSMDQARLIYEAPKDLMKEGTQVRPGATTTAGGARSGRGS